MKKTTIIIVMAVLCLSFEANAQLFTGRVVDVKDQAPLAGAIIKVQGQQQTALSNDDGYFELNLPSGKHVLHVQYLSYAAKEVVISLPLKAPLLIELTATENTLKEVEINAGYYTVKERERTGSISKISAETIGKQPVSNPLQALQGRVAGAYISQSSGTPGADISVIIRGQNGIETSTNPLYIIDGVPYNSNSLFNTLTGSPNLFSRQGSSPLNSIPPEDIASIEILKDADATSIYGSRGANGVILITTKKGGNGSKAVEINVQSGISDVKSFIPMLDTKEYIHLRKTAIALDGISIKNTDYDINGVWDEASQNNWQQQLIGNTAQFSNIRTAISGGNQLNTFLLSGSYQNQGTVYQGNHNFSRASVHFSASQSTTNKKLKTIFSGIYSKDKTNWLNFDYLTSSLGLAPNSPNLKNTDGSLNWASSTWINPLRAEENKYIAANSSLIANANISYTPLIGLEFRTSFGWVQQSLKDKSHTPTSYYDPAEGRNSTTSMANFNQTSVSSWTIEPQINFNKKTKMGDINLLLGMSLQDEQREQQILQGVGFASDALIDNIAAATTIAVRSNSITNYRYAGIYGRINYLLKDRYVFNLTGRRDASSRFGKKRRVADFGAIGLAYIFSDEKLIQEALPFVNLGKLRVSYGATGNDQIGDYEYLDTYQSLIGYDNVPALAPLRLLNTDFGWEINKKFELGIDLGLLKNRIMATIGYFHNQSSSQLIDYPLAMSTGFRSVRANLNATIENTGWEFEFSSHNVDFKKLRWTSNFNLTLPQNKLVEFPNLEASSYSSTYVVGQPLNIQKLLELKGVNPTTGIYEFTDVNGDKVINTADRQTIRKTGQTAYGGFENIFRYQKIELSFLFQFVLQRAASFRSQYNIMPGKRGNQPKEYQGKYWLKVGDLAELQRPSSGGIAAVNTALSNYTISDVVNQDASFARLKNVSITYSTDKLIKNLPVKIFLQGQNLYTVTNYFGIDPENATLHIPPLRTVTIGLNLTL